MFGRRYSLSCNNCSTQYVFKSPKKRKKFNDEHFGLCPKCEEYLDIFPLSGSIITPPPELKIYKREIHKVNMF
jgi:NAD-dependent SIR2 family protein deacetylase